MEILRKQFAKLDSEKVSTFRASLKKLHEATDGVFDIGTGCSGTDVAILALQTCVDFWSECFGIKFLVRHRISCEQSDFKRRFIKAHMTPETLTVDLNDLAQPMAQDEDGQLTHISKVLFWASGIE